MSATQQVTLEALIEYEKRWEWWLAIDNAAGKAERELATMKLRATREAISEIKMAMEAGPRMDLIAHVQEQIDSDPEAFANPVKVGSIVEKVKEAILEKTEEQIVFDRMANEEADRAIDCGEWSDAARDEADERL